MATPSQGLMRCSACGLTKPLSEMTAVAVKKNLKWKRCKACENSYAKKWRVENRDEFNAYHRQWRKNLGQEYNVYVSSIRKQKISKMSPEEQKVFRAGESAKVKADSERIKDKVFSAYGWNCNCCGESQRLFLSLDHVNNDGYLDRSRGKKKSSTRTYREVIKAGFPNTFQVLCMNCNFGKRMNNGVCPHKQGVTTMAQASRLK